MKSELIHDRIILLGVVSEGVKDYFYTSQCGSLIRCPRISGIELHGHIVSQLLRDARAGRAPIGTLSEGQEVGWIALWVLGGCLGWVLGAGCLAVFRGRAVWVSCSWHCGGRSYYERLVDSLDPTSHGLGG